MIRLAVITAILLYTGAVSAQEDPDCPGCVTATLSGPDPSVASGPAPQLRPQLIANHDHAWQVAGGISLGVGALTIGASWVMFAVRANYRLAPRPTVTQGDLDHWETLGAWSLWLGISGAAAAVAGEYLVLPESRGVPLLAWIGGAGGLALLTWGAIEWGSATHCAPTPVRPGAVFAQACTHGTSDLEFGPLLMLTSTALLNLPLVYLLRDAFHTDEPLSVNVGPRSVSVGGRF